MHCQSAVSADVALGCDIADCEDVSNRRLAVAMRSERPPSCVSPPQQIWRVFCFVLARFLYQADRDGNAPVEGYKIVNGRFRTCVSPLLTVAAMICAVTPVRAEEKKPNIVFMLMDNLGYGELGAYGGGVLRGAPTPRIDSLASQGMRLLNFNVESQCTPSRSALMTGRFPIRTGTYKVPLGGGPDGLTLWEVTIAELLSARGYATGTWGKWH